MKNNRYRYFVRENKDLTYTVFIYDLKYSPFNNRTSFHAKVEPKAEHYFSLKDVLTRLDYLDLPMHNVNGVFPCFSVSDMSKIIIDNTTSKRCYNMSEMSKRSKEFFGEDKQDRRAERK